LNGAPFFFAQVLKVKMVLKSIPTGIEKKFNELCQTVVDDCGLVLYDLEYFPGNQLLRLFVMDSQTESAVIEDCIKVDKAMTAHIEELDWMPSELTLEVSSPGVYRKLCTIKHFEMACGQRIKISLSDRFDSNTTGLPKSWAGENKVLATLESAGEESITFSDGEDFKHICSYERIKKANVDPELNNLIDE
jgi:ribosome maturation factor RimP